MSTQSIASLAESLSLLPLDQLAALIRSLPESDARALHYQWRGMWARPSQLAPGTAGAANSRKDWIYWIALAGRGWGKTRVGGEQTKEWGEDPKERILMIAPTAADIRDVMIEGPSGLLACYPPERRPIYHSSKRIVNFPSGAIGILRSADEPERLRGPQFSKFWADEMCAWRYISDAWAQLSFGFRHKTDIPLRGLITTTPKPFQLLKDLVADPDTVVTRGSSYENRANISELFYAKVIRPYEGTRLGRQEIEAEILEDVPGALWTQQVIDSLRVAKKDVPKLVRIVVAIDPAVTSSDTSAETGIGAVGLGDDGHCYVLEDRSIRSRPAEWCKTAVLLWCEVQGDRVVAEVNNGGDLVEDAIRAISPEIPYRAVRASRGKMIRAEPAAALYERGRVHHVGFFPDLESQMCNWVPNEGMKSPDRLDWLVWALYDLVLDPEPTGGIVTYNHPVLISRI